MGGGGDIIDLMKKILTPLFFASVFIFLDYNQVWSSTTILSSRWVESATAYNYFTPGGLRSNRGGGSWYVTPNLYKTVQCGTGEVVTGVRFYQIPNRVDEEHVDILCSATNIDMSSMSAPYWVESADGSSATCGYAQVMLGLRMYGYPRDVDDEHVDVLCANLNKNMTQTYSYYVEPDNAYAAISGYKTAQCLSGGTLTGTRFFKINSEIDDEHLDALCSDISAPAPAPVPVVNIKFR